MKHSLRASMAWLHGWAGLLAGWLLFAVFVTGTVSYYRDALSLWMQPELQSASHPGADPLAAAAHAVAFLQATAPAAPAWIIELPGRDGLLHVRWASERGKPLAPGAARAAGRFESAVLDPLTGAPAPAARATWGGDFFYFFHFSLHHLPVRLGRWLVSAAAMVLLVALLSGTVAHRRLFADFFTFRPGKGPRSWLDAHNATAVLTLPFQLMIAYSGLVALMFLTMPSALQALYGGQPGTFFARVLPQAVALPPATGRAAPLTDLPALLAQASRQWDGAAVARLTVLRPNDAAALAAIERDAGGRLAHTRQMRLHDASTGRLLASEDHPGSAPAQLRAVLYGLHLGRFADPAMRLLLAASGLAGAAMVGTGMLLWTAKRRARHPAATGLRLVDALHIAVLAGLPAAMATLLCANRLLPTHMAQRADWEIHSLFLAWAAMLALALARPTHAMWRLQLALGAAAFGTAAMLGALQATAFHAWVLWMNAALLAISLLLAGLAWRLGASQKRRLPHTDSPAV
jgi:uncharacterized iron-regulated membrane protein